MLKSKRILMLLLVLILNLSHLSARTLLQECNLYLNSKGLDPVSCEYVTPNVYITNESYIDHFNAYASALDNISADKGIDWYNLVFYGFVAGYITSEVVNK